MGHHTWEICPKASYKIKRKDTLFLGLPFGIDSLKEKLANEQKDETLQHLARDCRTFFPELAEFMFPSSCFDCIAGQGALDLRERGVNLVAIKRDTNIIRANSIVPTFVILPGDIAIVCRVPLMHGFSRSAVTDECLQKLAEPIPKLSQEQIDEAQAAAKPSLQSSSSFALSRMLSAPNSLSDGLCSYHRSAHNVKNDQIRLKDMEIAQRDESIRSLNDELVAL